MAENETDTASVTVAYYGEGEKIALGKRDDELLSLVLKENEYHARADVDFSDNEGKPALCFTNEAATGFSIGSHTSYGGMVFTLETPSAYINIPITEEVYLEIQALLEKKFG